MEKIWLKNYKPSIPPDIQLDNTTLIDMFAKVCARYPNNRAITCHGINLTFAQVYERVCRIAQGLADLGVVSGDRVALILPNSLQYPLSLFAILALGGVVVNINPLYTTHEIEYIIKDARPKVIIVLDMFSEKLNSLSSLVENIIVSKIADPYPFLKRRVIGLVVRYLGHVNPQLSYVTKKWQDFFNYPTRLSKFATFSGASLAFIQYTGGTTGRAKGAMLLHSNLVANIRQVSAVVEPQIREGFDKQIIISALPLYHILALTANLFTFFYHGAEIVMIPNARNLKDLVNTMNKTPFTVFNSLDTLYHKLLEYPAFIRARYPHFKYGICGGMVMRETIAARWYEHTGLVPTNCYGLTETSPCLTMSYFDEPFNGAVGYPVPSTEVAIRDIETPGRDLACGEKGLIFVRGPQLMAGYWEKPEQTQEVITKDGWFNTGDLGYLNEKGQLFISGREKEMIIVSGFNVYPVEVEEVINSLKEVREAAVVGSPDPDTGEAVHAFIVFEPAKNLSTEQIIAHCRQELTKYKLPHTITVVDELPKTLVGKVDKKALVAKYLKEEKNG